MQVPIAEREVREQPIQVETPHISEPVRGAFGEDVAQATENLGKAGMQLGDVLTQHIQRQAEYQAQETNNKLLTDYTIAQQNAMLSPDMETVKKQDGTTYQRHIGALMRRGKEAPGTLQDFDAKMLPLQQQLLAQQKSPIYRAELEKSFTHSWLSVRDNIAAHEAREKNQLSQDILAQFTQSQIQAYPYASAEARPGIISQVVNNIDNAYKNGVIEYNDAEKQKGDFYTSLVRQDVYNDNSTQEDKSPVLAELKKGKDGSYSYLPENTKIKLVEEAQRRIFQNNQTHKRVEIETDFNNRVNLLSDLANNKMSWADVNKNMEAINRIDPDLGQAIQKISMFPDDAVYRGKNIDDIAFSNAAQKMFEIKDNKALGDYFVRILKDSPSTAATKERLSILVSLARSQGIANNKNLPDSQKAKEENNNLRNIISFISMANPLLAPAMIVDLLRRKTANNLTGEQLKEETKKVINEHILNNYPQVRSLNGIPNKIVNGDNPVEDIYNGPNELQGEKGNGSDSDNSDRELSNEF